MSRGVAAGVLVLFAALRAQALPPDTWVVAIGENTGAAGDVGLLYAERDAREFAEVLRQQGHVSSERILVLQGEPADTVRRTLVNLNSALRSRSPGGAPAALVVFYSGHADATALHLAGTVLDFDELKGLVVGSPADVRLLVVDACRSGTVTRVKGVTPAETFELRLEDQVAASGVAIVTSSAAGESSQESDRLRSSFFTHHFLNALRGAADQNGDGRVTLDEAYEYAYAQTLRSTGQTLQLQHPTYSYDLKGRGELVLAEPKELRGREGHLRLAGAATYLLLDGSPSGPITAEVTTSAGGRELALPAGDYFVQQRLPEEYREYQVALPVGGEVDLQSVPFQDIRYDRLVRQRGGSPKTAQGLFVLAGARGSVLPGESSAPEAMVGYTVDLPWLTVGTRLRGATSSTSGVDEDLPRTNSEFGLGVTVQRVIDLPEIALGVGLLVEGAWYHQAFADTPREVPSRSGLGAAFGGLLSVEHPLWRGVALRLEGGPLTVIYKQAVIASGAQVGSQVATPFTGWVAGGVAWRF